ncbi:unnamed protein product [Ilex paraguariensis]|uniref:Protein TIME FOR COFFEE n=1 Tax=Ilex paraguariensis TaxID=185542 RepID=A0ABC8SX56_9AQUA
MDRNREARRVASMVPSNGLSRRRHRSNSLRDSPEDDGPMELQEPSRLRDRGLKKDRDRDRDRERERERDRDRSSRSKRRRAERLIHGGNREDGGEDSSEESVNDDEEDDEEDGGNGTGPVRMLPPNPMSTNHHLQPRKSYPPSSAKVFRAAPVWKAGDEMIGVSVPRKARTASTKRSHEWMNGGGGERVVGGGGEQIHRQASTSPVRQSLPSTSTPSPGAPLSPSSSNASFRKKMKLNGPKHRPPKMSSKSSSSNPEELEIEIAEVLYGLMTQSSKKEVVSNESAKFDSRELNKSTSDSKSRVSSPISNSPSTNPQSSAILPQNSSSSATPISAVAPKRKRPRQVSENMGSFGVRSSPISTTITKVEIDQLPKTEISSPSMDKNPGSAAENGGVPYDLGSLVNSQPLTSPSEPIPEMMKPDSESQAKTEKVAESRDLPSGNGDVTAKKEPPVVRLEDNLQGVTATATKLNSMVSEGEKPKEEKFKIDLMAPPPQLRSSPEREGDFGVAATVVEDHKPMISNLDSEMMRPKEDDKEAMYVAAEERKVKSAVEEVQLQKPVENKVRNIDLQLDLEKPERESGNNKFQHQAQKQQQPPPPKATGEESHSEKTSQSSSLPLPMSMASWPGGLPSMGYMTPLQGVVSMDGNAMSAPMQPHFSQPRPKRCATHCYIARNIYVLQQFMKMNPFWPAAAGTASLFGAKPSNLNIVPPAELNGNISGRGMNSMQDKGQGLAIFPGHTGKDKGPQAANIADAAQSKQQPILLQQAMPPVAPSNILHAPAFIFPLSQQQAAVAAGSVRPASTKSPTTTRGLASSNASSSANVSNSATTAGAATAMSFNYPNMPTNETQYLAILQNNAYPFPIPAVGAPPNYRGTHAQAMPLFNGSFYSSQMIHPSHLQQQQQAPLSQSHQMQQANQNTSFSSGSSSSQKHLQSQQQRPQGGAANGGNGGGNLHHIPATKNRPSQQQHQHQHQHQNQHVSLAQQQSRQLEGEVGAEDSPSTADSRISRATMSVYGQNFAMPIHPHNFALMTPPAALAGATTASGGGNVNDKKPQQPQQQGLKGGIESLPPQTFAMSFASINGATSAPGIDISSMAHNHAILQSFPEATRQSFQIMAAAAQVAQQKKNFRVSEDGKTGGSDSSNADEERKALEGKAPTTVGPSIAFSRDLTDSSGSAMPGNIVNLSSGPARTSRSPMPSAVGTLNASSSQLQAQLHHQQQQMIQLHKQQQQQQQQQFAAAVAARSKTPATSNGSVYSEHLTSSVSVPAKFPNAHTAFPQNLVQSSNSGSPAQSPQWKNNTRATTSQAPSSLAPSTPSILKNLPQQQTRAQQSHTQISFSANQKSSTTLHGQQQQPPSNNQSTSPPMVIGSPTISISKGATASGSPRTSSTPASNKVGQASALPPQQAKNSPSASSQKSSPVGGRNVPSILGSPHVNSSNSGAKPQMQQQQLPKNMQQAQIFFSTTCVQAQSPHSTSTSSTASGGGYYLQRRHSEQHKQPQQPPGSSSTSSSGMLSLCSPVSLTSATTTDPAKAIAAAAAASNMKGGSLPSQGILHAAQFAAQSSGNPHPVMPSSFSYVHSGPAAVQVKPAEQKQPAGNDNLHACWQPEKK